jgi:cation:H+ antiporter
VLLAASGSALALVLLALGADALVRGAVLLARRLRVSPFFIGLTIVGFGTSTPELFTSLFATGRGQVDLSVGNVVGSDIFNIALILGLTACLAPIPVRRELVRGQAWAVLAASLAPFLAVAATGRLDRTSGALLLAFLAAYVWIGYRRGRREGEASAREEALSDGVRAGPPPGRFSDPGRSPLLVAAGLAALVCGSALLVESASQLARLMGVSELDIGLTVVAAGTSAPELFTSLVAAARRQPDISVGNVLGSNVFNVAGILGLAALLRPQALNPQVLWLDAPVMVAVSAALIPMLWTGARLSRGEGAILLATYAAYLWALFAWAPGRFGAQGL